MLAALTPPGAAQTELGAIVITGTREPQPRDRITADLVVIEAQRIRDGSADSLEDLLRREAGMQISRNGGPGQSANVLIRGTGASNTLVLVDGVRVGSATLGQAEYESISLSQIERIEVLRGPGSSLYGADAIGGVVQIFTRRGDGAVRLTAHAAVGGESSRQGDIGLSGSHGMLDYAVGLGHERSDGVSALRPGDPFGNFNPDRDGYRRDNGQLRLGLTPAAGHRIGLSYVESRLRAQYDGSEFLPPDFAPDASPDFRNRLDTRVASLDYRGTLSETWTTSLQLSRNEDELQSGGTVFDHFDTEREQLTWQNALNVGRDHQIVVALERLKEQAQSTSYLADVERDNNAVVIGYSGRFGAHSLQADVRRDDSSVYGGVNTGRLGWSVEMLPGLRLRALAGTTFRAPAFNDLVFPGYGVDTLRPERGRSIETGLTWTSGDSEAAVTVYRNRVRDLIGYEPDRSFCPADPSYDFGCARNVNRARLQGATLSGAQRWGAWRLRATLDFLDAKDERTGARLVRRAAHQESLDVGYDGGAWQAGAALLRIGARPDGGAQLGSETTLDLRGSWRFVQRWRIEARLLNATDQDIEPARSYQGLGRQVWIGLRYDGRGF